MFRHRRERDVLVEVWHGINFATPVWAKGPQIGIVHHVHGDQFREVLPRGLSDTALFLERHVYPKLYRRQRLVAVSQSTRRELIELGFDGERINVVENGVAERFTPGGTRSPLPMVLVVSRLMPQKRVDHLVDILAEVRQRHPTLQATVVGDGPEREVIEAHVRAAGHSDWLHLEGRVGEERLLDLYRQAWVLASASSAEGWGMAITEAAACATPTVASRIPGHEDAVIHGVSGLLAEDSREFVDHLDQVIGDELLRARLMRDAVERVRRLRWPETAARLMAELSAEVLEVSPRPAP
jgi:glycosyltransferase involved in cell wall biosynthesis